MRRDHEEEAIRRYRVEKQKQKVTASPLTAAICIENATAAVPPLLQLQYVLRTLLQL